MTLLLCSEIHIHSCWVLTYYLLSMSAGSNLLNLHSEFDSITAITLMTWWDANTHEQPQGRQHRMTPHLPWLEPALTASCFVCLVKVPLHIPSQGHALPVGCLSCSSLAIHLPYPGSETLAFIPNKLCALETKKEKGKKSSKRSSLIIISKTVRGFIHACLSLKANEGGLDCSS